MPQMPPGLPAATTLDQLLQMINLQMQQQQAQQAQVQDMLRHKSNVQNARLPGVDSFFNNTVHKALDERHFRRIKVFENKSDMWKGIWETRGTHDFG